MGLEVACIHKKEVVEGIKVLKGVEVVKGTEVVDGLLKVKSHLYFF